MTAHRPGEAEASLCLSEYRLDRHLLGLESVEEKAEAEAHIAQCELCAGEVKEWQLARAQPVSLPAPLPSVEGAESAEGEVTLWARLQSFFGTKGMIWMPVASAACALVILIWVARPGEQPFSTIPARPNPPKADTRQPVPHTRDNPHKKAATPKAKTPGPGIFRQKGEARPLLLVERARDGERKEVPSGTLFREKDEVQLSYRWVAGGYLFLLFQDQAGEWSPLFPAEKTERSALIPQGGVQKLPDTFEVSGPAKGWERVWGCFSVTPVTYQEARLAVVALASKKQAATQKQPQEGTTCRWVVRFALRRAP